MSLSYSITIHKCQGQSLKCAIVDIETSVFGSVMSYVALSRVTSLDGSLGGPVHQSYCSRRQVCTTIKPTSGRI